MRNIKNNIVINIIIIIFYIYVMMLKIYVDLWRVFERIFKGR